MEFRILGPLEVSRDGRPVPVTGRHHPKLLAVLLLESGRVVSVSRLIEALWEYDPPATARRQVQNTLASLRRQLAGPGAPAIEATGEGYRIVLPTEAVDAQRFAQLARQGREAHERDELATASRLFGEALELWRGEALAGLSGRVVEAAVLRLNESRLAALEDRCEVDVALGRHGLVIGELRELLEHHRYRQRVAGLLMTALHHNGRTPEALEVYADLRNRLSTELGLDPDPELARLHGDILRGELTAPQAAETHPAAPRPAQLPAGTATFTGRRQHLTTLDELVEGGRTAAVVSAISGLGGAGKTALAVHWAHRIRDRFADGQLYLNLRGYDDGPPVAPADALARFLTALGQPGSAIPTDIDEAGAMYRSLLADRNMLILLDNARDAAQVRPLLPGGSGNFALVTSRDRLTSLAALDDAAPIRLDTLPHDESLELISHVLGTARVDTEPAAGRLARLCGGLPLALRIAAANIAEDPTRSITDYVTELAGPGRLDRLTVADDPAVAVAHTLDLSHDAVSPGAQRLFAILGLLPGEDFSEELALRLADATEHAHLTELESAHLLERQPGDRLRFHDLVREYARDRAETAIDPAAREVLVDRFVSWYYERRRTISDVEAGNVVAALRVWPTEHTWRLVALLSKARRTGIRPEVLLPLGTAALPAARAADDPEAVTAVYRSLALVHRSFGSRSDAVEYATLALETGLEAGLDDKGGANRYNLALTHIEVGEYAEAEVLLREAVRSATDADDTDNVALCKVGLAGTYRLLGKYAEAHAQLDSVEELDASKLNATPAWHLRQERAEINRDTGNLRAAVDAYDSELATLADSTDTRVTAITLARRGECLRRLGQLTSAHADVLEAVNLAENSGYPSVAVTARLHLAEVLSDQGHHADAAAVLEVIPHEGTAEPDRELAAALARLHCLIHVRRGDFAAAIPHGTQARDLYAAMPNPLLHARTLALLAQAHTGRGDAELARTARRQAHDIRAALGVPGDDI